VAADIEEIAPDLHRVVDSRRSRSKSSNRSLTESTRANLDTLMPLYEPEAAFAAQPGNLSQGLPGVRQALAGFVAMKGKLDLNVTRVLEVSDLALVMTAWSFIGTGTDGKPVKLAARSADVLRRQADGSWRFVIDNPWGTD
jgi:ketosteroid isomerase-like protein